MHIRDRHALSGRRPPRGRPNNSRNSSLGQRSAAVLRRHGWLNFRGGNAALRSCGRCGSRPRPSHQGATKHWTAEPQVLQCQPRRRSSSCASSRDAIGDHADSSARCLIQNPVHELRDYGDADDPRFDRQPKPVAWIVRFPIPHQQLAQPQAAMAAQPPLPARSSNRHHPAAYGAAATLPAAGHASRPTYPIRAALPKTDAGVIRPEAEGA